MAGRRVDMVVESMYVQAVCALRDAQGTFTEAHWRASVATLEAVMSAAFPDTGWARSVLEREGLLPSDLTIHPSQPFNL